MGKPLIVDENLLKEIIEVRRDLHKIPEAGNEEFLTTEYIWNYVKKLGFNPTKGPLGTGVIVFEEVIPGAPTIAFRADIDGLSVKEETKFEFASEHPGFMHACGHDAHMAILLGFMKLISEKKESLKKNLLFIFQPAEEGPGGAKPIVETGILRRCNVESIFGLHVYPDVPEGYVSCRAGAFFAGTGEFDIKVMGKSCHGALPHRGTDALIAGCSLISALNTIVSRNIDPLETAVVTVGEFKAGERRNVIAGEAVMAGTMRAFSEEVMNIIVRRIDTLSNEISKSFECSVEADIRVLYPPVINDPELVKMVEDVCGDKYISSTLLTVSEDFSYFQKEIPGVFFLLGIGNNDTGCNAPLHNNKFKFNEKILGTGISVFYGLAEINGII